MKAEIEQSLASGVDWLVAQQAEDGGWHSKTYGQLKDGAAVTTLIADALSQVGPLLDGKPTKAIVRAFEFLSRGLKKRGTIASPDGSLDFPTYAAALWITGRLRLKGQLRDHENAQGKLVEYLVAAQVAEPRGFLPDSSSFGGWDFLGPNDAQGITTGTNISITRYVLEALLADVEWRRTLNRAIQLSELKRIQNAQGLARKYVLRCQQADGGFAFTCEPASLNNKAAYADTELSKPRSYGTATCDGVRALVACGLKTDEEPVAKALTWLAQRTALELVPGFEGLPPESGWDRALRYYYYGSLRRVLSLLPLSDRAARSEALSKHVIGLQKGEGHWINESDRMRENDPLIATALAISALAAA